MKHSRLVNPHRQKIVDVAIVWCVISAQAGIQDQERDWIPAFSGMTKKNQLPRRGQLFRAMFRTKRRVLALNLRRNGMYIFQVRASGISPGHFSKAYSTNPAFPEFDPSTEPNPCSSERGVRARSGSTLSKRRLLGRRAERLICKSEFVLFVIAERRRRSCHGLIVHTPSSAR